MKILFTCFISLLVVIGCATATAPAPCEPALLAEHEDYTGNVILMIDENCDGECDFSLLLEFIGVNDDGEPLYVPVAKVTCEKAEWILKEYTKDLDNNSVSM